MNRNTLTETAGRVMHVAARITLNNGNDNLMMQELNFDGMNSDGRNKVERVQSFGFSSVPLPRDALEKAGKAVIDGIEQAKGAAAEGIALFIGGQRNHPVVIGMDDRRHRPMGMKPGENAQYDDQGQMTAIRRDGVYILSTDDDGSGTAPGARMLRDHEGKLTGQSQQQQRMVSLRHVNKRAQARAKVGSAQPKAVSQEEMTRLARERQDYKHEGDTVNTEVRCTRGAIQIMDGDTAVATYDKLSGAWTFKSKVINLQAIDTMTLTAANHMTIQCINGPTDIIGKPIKANGGGSSVPRFTVPG